MTTFNQLNEMTSIENGDQIPFFSTSNGSSRRISASAFKAYCQQGVTANDDKLTQYSSPSATGFSVQVNNASNSVFLLLTPTGTLAAGTLVLPLQANCVDRQEILVHSTQTVTTLTINGNGSSLSGAPSTITAGGFFSLRFDNVNKVWYRVG
jgi:hypothetical protein